MQEKELFTIILTIKTEAHERKYTTLKKFLANKELTLENINTILAAFIPEIHFKDPTAILPNNKLWNILYDAYFALVNTDTSYIPLPPIGFSKYQVLYGIYKYNCYSQNITKSTVTTPKKQEQPLTEAFIDGANFDAFTEIIRRTKEKIKGNYAEERKKRTTFVDYKGNITSFTEQLKQYSKLGAFLFLEAAYVILARTYLELAQTIPERQEFALTALAYAMIAQERVLTNPQKTSLPIKPVKRHYYTSDDSNTFFTAKEIKKLVKQTKDKVPKSQRKSLDLDEYRITSTPSY